MENNRKFVLRLGHNMGRYCDVQIDHNHQFCQFHRYIAYRLNNKKKTLKAAVALHPEREDTNTSYHRFPFENYDEYEYYEDHTDGIYLSFSSSNDENNDHQHDYITGRIPMINNTVPSPPINNNFLIIGGLKIYYINNIF